MHIKITSTFNAFRITNKNSHQEFFVGFEQLRKPFLSSYGEIYRFLKGMAEDEFHFNKFSYEGLTVTVPNEVKTKMKKIALQNVNNLV